MKPIYIAPRGFWIRRALLRLLRGLLALTAVLVSLGLTAVLLGAMVLGLDSGEHTGNYQSPGDRALERFDTTVTNRLSDALAGIRAIEKVYWLSDVDPVAPEPDPEGYGSTSDPAALEALLQDAGSLLDGKELYFDPNAERKPGTAVQYYLDDTILAITWKEIHNYCVYTVSEVVIAHPSQFRRFLSGGQYGSGQQVLTTEMSASVNAVVASSGDFYAYRRYGVVVQGGQLYRANSGGLDACFIDENGDMQFLYAWQIPGEEELRQYLADNHIRFSLAFGPVIVDGGQQVATGTYPVGENGSNFSRAALCQMGQLHYLVVTANMEYGYSAVPTLWEFARQICATGCEKAYTLDGGQTAAIAMNDALVNQVSYGSQRRISDIIYFATALPDGG